MHLTTISGFNNVNPMPYTGNEHVNQGAYDQPFSGVGVEYYPLGVKPERSGLTLHECGYLADNSNWNFPGVFSPFWRLYYNFERGHCVLFGNRMVELTPEHIMLIPAHQMFHCLGGNPVPTLWFAFSFVKRLHPDVEIPVLLSPRDTELCLMRDLSELIAANHDWQPTDAIYRTALALLQVTMARPQLNWQAPIPDNLVRTIKFIEANINQAITNPELARHAGLSVEGFSRAFRQHYGITPGRYVTEVRVREASRMLLQTDESIEIIADATGFPNRAYFSRVFKKVTDASPANFRSQHSSLQRSA